MVSLSLRKNKKILRGGAAAPEQWEKVEEKHNCKPITPGDSMEPGRYQGRRWIESNKKCKRNLYNNSKITPIYLTKNEAYGHYKAVCGKNEFDLQDGKHKVISDILPPDERKGKAGAANENICSSRGGDVCDIAGWTNEEKFSLAQRCGQCSALRDLYQKNWSETLFNEKKTRAAAKREYDTHKHEAEQAKNISKGCKNKNSGKTLYYDVNGVLKEKIRQDGEPKLTVK